MNRKKWWLLVPLVLLAVYLLGPHPATPSFDKQLVTLPSGANALEDHIARQESQHQLRPDNQARIIWADSAKTRTPYAIVYLHGFSASQAEGDPVHTNIARRFGCNLYLTRLAEHGIDTSEQLLNVTADKLWNSATEALSVASQLGEKVIIMGTSTGGTLALQLAAAYPDIHAIIMLSPNIAIFDKNAWLLNNPWGLQIARMVIGSKYVYSDDTRPVYKQYWNYGYRLEAVTQLQEMLETTMHPDLFRKVTQPALMLYYYRDQVHQDSVVRVDAMLDMFSALGTPQNKKRSVNVPSAGNHVLGSYIKSQDTKSVENAIAQFMEEVLQIKPLDTAGHYAIHHEQKTTILR